MSKKKKTKQKAKKKLEKKKPVKVVIPWESEAVSTAELIEPLPDNPLTAPPKKHPGGRPTNCTKDVMDATRYYLGFCRDEQYRILKSDGKASTSWDNKWRVFFPSIAGLARYLRVARNTIRQWREKNPEFDALCEDILAEQESRLLSNGLSGDYNPQIAKMILTKHGYSDDETPKPPQQNFFNVFIQAANTRIAPTPVESRPVPARLVRAANKRVPDTPVPDTKAMLKELVA